MNGLNPNGVPPKPGVPDSDCGFSAFHQLKPDGVGNWAPNWLANGLPNCEANGELNQFHGVGAHWFVGWFHGLNPWEPFQLFQFHGVFHELFDQLLVADHGEEFQSPQLLPPWKPANGENWPPKDWFHDGLNPWKPWNPGNDWKPLNPNGVLNMCISLWLGVGVW